MARLESARLAIGETSQAEARWAPYLTAVRFSEEIHQAAKTTDSLEIKYLESLPQ